MYLFVEPLSVGLGLQKNLVRVLRCPNQDLQLEHCGGFEWYADCCMMTGTLLVKLKYTKVLKG